MRGGKKRGLQMEQEGTPLSSEGSIFPVRKCRALTSPLLPSLLCSFFGGLSLLRGVPPVATPKCALRAQRPRKGRALPPPTVLPFLREHLTTLRSRGISSYIDIPAGSCRLPATTHPPLLPSASHSLPARGVSR